MVATASGSPVTGGFTGSAAFVLVVPPAGDEPSNVGTLAAFSIVCLTVIYLRFARPKMNRPFKTPLFPITPLLGALMCIFLLLSLMSLLMVFLVLYSRYRSVTLAAIIMANIPLALIGSVVAMWLAGVTLSVASMVGFITLAGIASRNGILKISHYINLCQFEGERFGEAMVVRGSLERLTPVLMTALVAAFALTPLLLAADAPGKEILHPVAVVIFGGLVSSTLLDTLITPLVFAAVGRAATERLVAEDSQEAL